jgi:hypothetical protein
MIANGQVKLIVFQAVYDYRPKIIKDLMTFLEHPPYSGSFTIHAVNGEIAYAEKKETVKD